MGKKSHITQSLVNIFPLWADIRTDEQSLGYQFLNNQALKLENLLEQLEKAYASYYLPTSWAKDIDVFYKFTLPRDYSFVQEDDDETELNYIAPTVSGFMNGAYHYVTLASGNNVENWWYRTTPNRISIGTSYSGAYLVCSGFLNQSVYEPLTLSGIVYPNNSLLVTVSGGNSYIGINEENYVRNGLVQIEGITRAGVQQVEELVFLHDDAIQTTHQWKEVTEVRAFGIEPASGAFLNIYGAKFNTGPQPLAYQFDTSIQDNAIPTFWDLGTNAVNNKSTLELVTYDSEEFETRLNGFVDRSSVLSIELLDLNGNNIIARDLAPEPYSDRLWIVSSGNLFCYDASLPYPEMKTLLKKNTDSMCRIEVNKYYLISGQLLEMSYIWRRPVMDIIRHRVWVQHPDGTKQSIINGVMTTYVEDETSWVYGDPISRSLRSPDYFTLTNRGIYTFTLEVLYADETTSLDKRIVYVVSKHPLREFSFLQNGLIDPIIGVDIDADGKLWVLSTTGGRHEIQFIYDNMIIDYANKVIYLRDDYESIKVDLDG